MVEMTKEALADARRWMCALPRDQFDKLLVLGEDARQAGVRQGLDMAAGVVEEGSSRWRDKSSATANKRESRDYETMAIACIHVAAAIRKLGGGDA